MRRAVRDASGGVDDRAPLVHDSDLNPDLRARGDQLVDRRLHLPLRVVHGANSQNAKSFG